MHINTHTQYWVAVFTSIQKWTYLESPWMHPARSLVIVPLSTVSTHTLSRVWENLKINKGVIRCILGKWSEDVLQKWPTLWGHCCHQVCHGVPGLWSMQRCWQWGWCWLAFPERRILNHFSVCAINNIHAFSIFATWWQYNHMKTPDTLIGNLRLFKVA